MPHQNKNARPATERNESLHGNAPDRASIALLLVDVINDLEFPNNKQLVRQSVSLAKSILRLKRQCKQAGIPTIYINDNYGKWRSDVSALLRHCLRRQAPGRAMVKALIPEPEDYVVLKPKHSAFYATPLETLLEYIGVRTVIVAGITTNACVMITASDLYVRDFRLFVPPDCVTALSSREQRNSLNLMRKKLCRRHYSSQQLNLSRLSNESNQENT